VLSLRLVPWRNQVYLEFAFEISLVTNLSNSSMHLVYIFLGLRLFLSILILAAPGLK
jgi:hypothetical protein